MANCAKCNKKMGVAGGGWYLEGKEICNDCHEELAEQSKIDRRVRFINGSWWYKIEKEEKEKEVKTLFQQKAEEYREKQDSTKEEGLRSALGILGISLAAVVGGIVLFPLMWAVKKLLALAVIMVIIGGTIGTVGGIIFTVVAFVSPSKLVTCPICRTEHRIYKSIRKYICASCRVLLLLGNDSRLIPHLSTCPYCELQTAVSDDHGRFLCPNCGIIRQPSGTDIGETKTCPECKNIVPKESIYCKFCENILKSNFAQPTEGDPLLAYDEYWKIGKDATGHFYFAKALLKLIQERIDMVEKTKFSLRVAEVQLLLSKLTDSLMSLEEALQEPNLRSSVAAFLPEVDLTYTDLLKSELRGVQSRTTFPKEALPILVNEPHITARERIENIFADSLESFGSIGKWNGKLVDVEKREDDILIIHGYQRLEAEVNRFTEWKTLDINPDDDNS